MDAWSCEYELDGYDTDGTEWWHCTVHDVLAPGDGAPCAGWVAPPYGGPTVSEQDVRLSVLRDEVHVQVDRELERAVTSDSYSAMGVHLRRAAALADALVAADDRAEGYGMLWVHEDERVPSAIRLLQAYVLAQV